MTFEQFKAIAEYSRKDVLVFNHGSFCSNKSKNTLGVVFVNNGKESEVYDYSGSYQQVLAKLGVEVYTSEDVANVEAELERYTKRHGKKKSEDAFHSIFSKKCEGVFDYSKEIRECEEKLENMKSKLVEVIYKEALKEKRS